MDNNVEEYRYNIAGIIKDSWENGEGMRSVIFFAGCKHKCPRCQNKIMQDPSSGTTMNMKDIIRELGDTTFITGITLSGGDPFYNIEQLYNFLRDFRKIYPKINIWVYTGYTYNELLDMKSDKIQYILDNINTLVDGKFVYTQSNYYNPDIPAVKYRGSINQNIISLH